LLGNLSLGNYSFGIGSSLDRELNCPDIFIISSDVETAIKINTELNSLSITVDSFNPTINVKAKALPNIGIINVEHPDVERRITYRIKPQTGIIGVEGLPVHSFYTKKTPTIEQYIDHIKDNIRTPVYKVELLRKEDESVLKVIEGDIIDDSGSVNNTLDEGVRRTCDFSLPNYDGRYNDFIENISIGDKFKLYLGYKIDDIPKYFPQGVFVFDDPAMTSNLSERKIELSGTDKWSMLNGQNGGILEGTYTVEMGSKVGDLIRKTLRLNIVGDPVEPSISKEFEDMEITYDITKSAGETISDVLLEVALNISAYIYYDENGRLNMYPSDDADMYKAPAYSFSKDEYNYLNATKQYQLSEIYNSVLVVGENIQNSETPITYEALNNDLSDPNSIPNVGFKKVKMITEYVKGIDTLEKAQARANWELKKARAKLSNVDINCLALYHLDVNQIVELTDTYLNSQKERFLINSIELPIGVDIQSTINLAKAVEIE
jgi:hypothetical protein